MQKINRHMTHAEDTVLKGVKDIKIAVELLSKLYGSMAGYHDRDHNEMNLSVKIDGAPAIFAWSKFPGIPGPGIAMKGLFSKNPKTLLNQQEIDLHYGDRPELAYKLKTFMKYLKKIKIPEGEIWQGDFLFDSRSLSVEWIGTFDANNRRRVKTFHPNTILYSLYPRSRKFDQCEVGICWHTRYKGDNLNSVVASYDAYHEVLKKTKGIFMTDPYIEEFPNSISTDEANLIEKELSWVLETSYLFDGDEKYHKFLDNGLSDLMLIYVNMLIKDEKNPMIKEFVEGFKTFIMVRFAKIAGKMKTTKGSTSKLEIGQSYLDFIEENRILFCAIKGSMNKIQDIKHLLIEKLNHLGEFDTHIKSYKGIKPSGQEGFALSDYNGNAIKLINRREFSYNNFSPDVVKGWQ